MKKVEISEFVFSLKSELDDFEQYQTTYSVTSKKNMSEWVDSFMDFAGYSDSIKEEESDYDDYEEELYYGDSYEFEEIVNRRKYRSFRDDDSY